MHICICIHVYDCTCTAVLGMKQTITYATVYHMLVHDRVALPSKVHVPESKSLNEISPNPMGLSSKYSPI